MKLTLNEEQIRFLLSQKIPISHTFDARGYSKKEYSEIMKEEDLLVAYNVTPCQRFSHTLRSRHGHCIQCNTQALAFIRRYSENGIVYLLHSDSINKCKVGTCKNMHERLSTLNSQGYGSTNDWQLIEKFETINAARIEYNIRKLIDKYRFETHYIRTGRLIKCQEIYDCPIKILKEAIKKARL